MNSSRYFVKFTKLLVHFMIMAITLIASENIFKYYKRSHTLFKRLRNVDALSLAAPSVNKTEHFESFCSPESMLCQQMVLLYLLT